MIQLKIFSDDMGVKHPFEKFKLTKLFVFYLILVSFDIVTTLMTDVDLKYEGNVITTFFVNNQYEFIVYVYTIAFASVICVYFSNQYLIKSYYCEKKNVQKLFLSSIIIVFFITHLLSLFWVIPNNILHNIGINGNTEWPLFQISKLYIHFGVRFYPYYQIIMQVVLFVFAILIFMKLSKIKVSFNFNKQ